MNYDITKQVEDARLHFEKILDEKIKLISKLSGVDKAKLIPINPADFIEKNKYQTIHGYEFKQIGKWIAKTKTDDNYLISPEDDAIKSANQISYKEKIDNIRIRGSKCKIIPISSDVALDFYRRNHRQSLPNLRWDAISYGLTYHGLLVGAMTYDKTGGAVRGKSKSNMFELMRLAFAQHYSIAGGASRLQKHCEETLRKLGETEVFSYSNATINSGRVYSALGFESKKVDNGQPFVIMEDFSIKRLIELHPFSTDKSLALNGRMKSHLGGNKLWIKKIAEVES